MVFIVANWKNSQSRTLWALNFQVSTKIFTLKIHWTELSMDSYFTSALSDKDANIYCKMHKAVSSIVSISDLRHVVTLTHFAAVPSSKVAPVASSEGRRVLS